MKLSIIICVYDTPRDYLEACLSSITESTLGEGGLAAADYEICMVDDGSSVDYSDLVQRYGLKYKKTENRGIFSARLTGIDMAEGDFIAFVDSDDTVSWNYHRPMLEVAKTEKLDVVINGWAFHTERTRYCCTSDVTVKEDLFLEGDGIIRAFLSQEGRQHSFFVLWNKLFRRELLRRVREELFGLAQSPERFNYSEDALMCFYAFLWADRVKNIHTGYYLYRVHGGQTVVVSNQDKLKRQIDCMCYTLDRMESEVKRLADASALLSHVRRWRQMMSRTHYSQARGTGFEELYPYIKEKYGVEKLRRARFSDGKYYVKARLLPENMEHIEKVLLDAYKKGTSLTFDSDYRDYYIREQLSGLRLIGITVNLEKGGQRLPKPLVKLKNRIIMNGFVRRVGMILFPKGSKIRAFLKKRI